MPYVTEVSGSQGKPIYQVGGRSFIFFRNPRPDATDARTGEKLTDVIMFWTQSELDKHALLHQAGTPFFTTPHFDGHPSVLLCASRIPELSVQELRELVQDAWLARASARRGAQWLASKGLRDEDVTVRLRRRGDARPARRRSTRTPTPATGRGSRLPGRRR